MSENEVVSSEQTLIPLQIPEKRELEIPGAPPVRLQTLDLARHIAIAPDHKQYVVATFADRNFGRDYVTTIYPQQGGYHTLVRLPLCEYVFSDPEEALQRHVELVQVIQQGKLRSYLKEK
ncbi:hypothetical protein [Dictyobacter aurantiacus]|uniref:Uncharacterized protein n=1 Tax=Dictyobacter aurantiacus TaxID=1936993 RepID=A0A401Z9Z5_9CHLR|nr:hypothetical protein [Dictyobacter aurantiacus]GCE03626.1 hypothetical protein KDAU_09550 [Dictyobacter aurantiacus]